MPNYYRYLNLPNNFLDVASVVEKYSSLLEDSSKNKQWRIENTTEVFNKVAQDWLKQFECQIGLVEIFYTAPHSKISWHIDINVDCVKINFVCGPKDNHYMKWGKTKIENYIPEIGYNSVGSPHMLFKPEDIDEEESLVINKPVLVNVGMPHRAVNDSNVGRWCICLIPKKGINRISFSESVDLFKEYVI